MKIINTIFLIILAIISYSQVTVYSENCGSTLVFFPVSTYNGWQHPGNYGGTASVRNTLPSTGYAGASGGANVFFTNTAGTYLQINNIDTRCYLFAFLSIGIWKNTNASNGSEFLIEYSEDGVTWVQMPYTLPTGSGTAIWRNLTLADYLPLIPNLQLRFTQLASTTVQFRIDDINVAGIQNIQDSIVFNCYGFSHEGNIYNIEGTYDFTYQDEKGCDSILSISYIYDPTDPTCLLPVELVFFKGRWDGEKNVLQWETASEFNNDYWKIERSPDAMQWEELRKILAFGTSSCSNGYMFFDRNPLDGINYYRLSQIDFDGNEEIFDIIYIDISKPKDKWYDLYGREVTPTKGMYFSNDKKIIIK